MGNDSSQALFRGRGYLHLSGVIDLSVCELAYRYMMLKCATGRFQYPAGDTYIPGAPGEYGDPLTEALLGQLEPIVERVTGLETLPTFSYCRVYFRGEELPAHNDRIECEIGVSACMGGQTEVPWTFNLDAPAGTVRLATAPGDIVVYKACEMTHQRDPLQGDHQAQVFLFYVNRNGPLSSLRFDSRPGLAVPRS